jgi:hypothetical protein
MVEANIFPSVLELLEFKSDRINELDPTSQDPSLFRNLAQIYDLDSQKPQQRIRELVAEQVSFRNGNGSAVKPSHP